MKRIAALLTASLLAVCLSAQQHPNLARGFNANSVYDVHDYDSINAFNGNLTLSIPLGKPYPVTSDFSLPFVLHANSNVWESEKFDKPCSQEGEFRIAYPHRRANAGLGWTLHLGRLFEPVHPSVQGWAYEAPDGADHHFPGGDQTVSFTKNGSYLRMTQKDATTRLIEFPDGKVHTFVRFPQDYAEWRLTKISRLSGPRTAAGVALTDLVAFDYHFDATTNLLSWWEAKIPGASDFFAKATFTPAPYETDPYMDPAPKRMTMQFVSKFELRSAPASEGLAVYELTPRTVHIGRQEKAHTVPNMCMPDDIGTALVTLLDSVKLPDGTSFRFLYDEAQHSSSATGLPERMTLPNGGFLRWHYAPYSKPDWSAGEEVFTYTWGVTKRSVFERGAAETDPLLTKEYVIRFDDNDSGDDRDDWDEYTKYQKTTIRETPRTVVAGQSEKTTENYFFLARHPTSWDRPDRDYGRPLTKVFSHTNTVDGRTCYLSQRTLAGGSPVQSTYVCYEDDEPANVWGPVEGGRVATTRVVRHDDADRMLETHSEDWTGWGRYRKQTVQEMEEDEPQIVIRKRTTTTQYDGYPAAPETAPWLSGRYSSVTLQDGDVTAVAQYAFDGHTGVLDSKRTQRTDALLPTDLQVKYTHDALGNVLTEQYFGGDSAEATHPCPVDAATACYGITHAYSNGILSSSTHTGMPYPNVSFAIDPDSHLPVSSSDAAGVVTTFKYDRMGRIAEVHPTGSAWTQYAYTAATASTFATIAMTQYAIGDTTTPLTRSRYHYDSFGRLVQESRLQAGGNWSTTWTAYDQFGRKDKVSVARSTTSGAAADFPASSTYTQWKYDALDRVESVKQPDGALAESEYPSGRITIRKDTLATSATAESQVRTLEERDGFGRLVMVMENFGGTGAQTTSYSYDFGDRLARVESGEQVRTFTYDEAGLLTSEDHPESALTTYRYDAKGHVIEKKIGASVWLQYAYDAAERLRTVTDKQAGAALKTLTYDGDAGNGRLWKQQRRNAFPGLTVLVTDTFRYDAAGRVDRKQTEVDDGTFPAKVFSQAYDYTSLGAPLHVSYPACEGCGGQAALPRSLELGYDNGMLTGIEKVTAENGITYTPSGAVHQVQHLKRGGGNGVLETYTPDSNGMGRPAAISFQSARDCDLIEQEPADVTVARYAGATLSVDVADGATVEWFRGPLGGSAQSVGTGPTLDIETVPADAVYWCRVRLTAAGCEEVSREARVTVCTPPEITSDYDKEYPASPGAQFRLSVEATGTNLTYSWTSGSQHLGDTSSILYTAPAAPGTYEVFVAVAAACGDPVSVRVATVQVVPPVAEQDLRCEIRFLSDFDPMVVVPVPNAGRRLTATVDFVEDAGEQRPVTVEYWFRWWENGKNVVTKGPLASAESIRDVYVHAVDKKVRVEAWADCSTPAPVPNDPSRKLIQRSATIADETYATVSGRCTPPAVVAGPLAKTFTEAEAAGHAKIALTAEASRPDVTYQWYRGNSGYTHDPIAGATGPVLEVDSVVGTYWVRVRANCGATADSETVMVSSPVCSPVVFTTQPQDASIAAGTSVKLAAEVGTLPVPSAYQWYRGGNSIIRNATDSAYTATPLKTTDYWMSATNGCNTGWTRKARLHVVSCAAMDILEQPQDRDAVYGAAEQISISAQPAYAGDTLQYQWYRGESGDTGDPVTGQTQPALVVPAPAQGRYWVRMSFPDSSRCQVDSRTVKVCAPLREIGATQHQNAPTPGESRIIGVNVEGEELTFEWYAGVVSETTKLSSVSAIAQVAPQQTTTYICRVRSHCSGGALPPLDIPLTVYVCPTLTAAPQAAKSLVMPGTTTTLSISVPAGRQVQWYSRPKGTFGGGTVIGSGTAITTPPIAAATEFWAVVSSDNCSRESAIVEVNVCSGLEVHWSNTNATRVAYGTTQTVTAFGTAGTNYRFDFYEGPQAGNVQTSTLVSSGNGNTYTYSATATRKLWVRLIDAQGNCWADSSLLTVQVCVPTITAHPQPATLDKTSNAAASVLLSVTATPSSGLTYQWYTGASGNMANPIPGATGATYAASPNVDTTYWVQVRGGCTEGVVTRDSTAATVTLCKAPSISQHPQTQVSTAAGQSKSLSVIATGTELTYTWYRGASGVTSSPTGDTTASITVSPNETTDYWVRVSGRCGPAAASTTAKISVPPSISVQPQSAAVTYNTTKQLSVTASGTQLSYRWYSVSGGIETAQSGATAATFTPPPVTATASYFCRVWSGDAPRDSAIATMTVCQPRPIAQSAHSNTSGSEVTLSVVGAEAGETFEWYQGASGVTSTPLGTGTSLKVYPQVTTSYWVRTKRSGCDADSAAATVTICYPKITAQPAGTTVTLNNTATLTVSATGNGPLSYQWYEGASGLTTTPVGTNSATFVTPPLTAARSYWVRVSSPFAGACPTTSANSVTATIAVCTPPDVKADPVATNVASSSASVNLQVTAAGDGLSYQWYEGASGVTATPVGSNSPNLTIVPGTTKSYWVRVTGSCGVDDSAAALVSVSPSISVQPVSRNICGLPAAAEFSVTASGAGLSYRWYRRYSGAWEALTDPTATAATLQTTVSQVPVYYRVGITSGNATTYSNDVTVTVLDKPTITSISRTSVYTGTHKLTANVPIEDQERGVSYAWYKGALGNTSQLIGGSSYVTVTPTPPQTYWVRVKYDGNGCYADKSYTF